MIEVYNQLHNIVAHHVKGDINEEATVHVLCITYCGHINAVGLSMAR